MVLEDELSFEEGTQRVRKVKPNSGGVLVGNGG